MFKKNIFLPSLVIVFFTFIINTVNANSSFNDVGESHLYFDAIEYLKEQNIINGYPDGTFKPNQSINRAEFVKIIVNSIVSPSEVSDCMQNQAEKLFPDVETDLWYNPYLCVAKEKGLIGGYPDGEFKGSRQINFVESAKIVINGMKTKPGFEDFKSVEEGSGENWFQPFVAKLEQKRAIPIGIQSFSHEPTRGEISEIYYRLLTNNQGLETNTFVNLANSCSPAMLGGAQDPLVSEFGGLPVQMGIIDCQNTPEAYRLADNINRAEAVKVLFTLKLFSLMPDLTNEEREEIKNKNYINRVSVNYNPKDTQYQSGQYPDVTKEAWYADYLANLTKWGVVAGDDLTNNFRPGSNMNHAEAIKMVVGSYLTGGELQIGQPVIQEWNNAQTWTFMDQEDQEYFVAAHEDDLKQIAPAFNLSANFQTDATARKWYTPYLAEAEKAKMGGVQSIYFNDHSVSKNMGDNITRGDFILWAMRIFSNENQDKLIFKADKGFQIQKDNIAMENDGFVPSLGYFIHGYDLRYVVPKTEMTSSQSKFIQSDANYQNKPDYFFSDEMEASQIGNRFKLRALMDQYIIKGRKGEDLNEEAIFDSLDNSGGNCAGFNMITPSIFDGFENLEHYASHEYSRDSNQGVLLTENDRSDLYDLQSSDYVWKDLIVEGGKQKQLVRLKDSIGYWWRRQDSKPPTVDRRGGEDPILPSEFVREHVDYFKAHPEYIDENGHFKYLPWRLTIRGSRNARIEHFNRQSNIYEAIELKHKTNLQITGTVRQISNGKIIGIQNAEGFIHLPWFTGDRDDTYINLIGKPTLFWEFEAPAGLQAGDTIKLSGNFLQSDLSLQGDITNWYLEMGGQRRIYDCPDCTLSGRLVDQVGASLTVNGNTIANDILVNSNTFEIEFAIDTRDIERFTESNEWGHTLNQYQMKKIGDHKYHFGLYDSNHPTMNQSELYLELDTQNETWDYYWLPNGEGSKTLKYDKDDFMTRKHLYLEDNSFINHAVYNVPTQFIKQEEDSNL